MARSKRSTLEPNLYYLRRNIYLTPAASSQESSNTAKSAVTFRFSNLRRRAAKLYAILPSLAAWLRVLWLPKGQTWVFNHTGRFRKGPNGPSSVYLNRIAEHLHPFIVVEDQPTSVRHGKESYSIRSDILNILPTLISKLFPRGNTQESSFWWKMRFWKWAFFWTRPSKVYVLVWYSKEWAIAAAHLNGISVIELQHGLVYEEHPFYDRREEAANEGSGLLLPDTFLAYGEYWRQRLLRLGWPEDRVRIGGYFPDISPKNDPSPFQPYILYTSQPGYQQEIIDHVRSIKPQLARLGLNVIIALHPHPAESQDIYRDILDDRVRLSQLDSYDLLRGCICHLSVSSTLLWEALLFKKPSYMLNTQKYFPGLASQLLSLGTVRPIQLGEVPKPFTLPETAQTQSIFEDLRTAF